MPSSIRVDPTSLEAGRDDPVGLAPKGSSRPDTAVWVADTHDGKVYRIDPKTNKIVATITVGPTGYVRPELAWKRARQHLGRHPEQPDRGPDRRGHERDPGDDPDTDVVTPCGGFAVTPTAVWNTSCDGPRG